MNDNFPKLMLHISMGLMVFTWGAVALGLLAYVCFEAFLHIRRELRK